MPPLTLEIGREGGSLRSVAIDRARAYAALGLSDQRTVVEAYADGKRAWSTPLAGAPGPMAAHATALALALSVTGDRPHFVGEPGALVLGLAPATGAQQWQLALASNEWVVVTALAAADDGFIVGGSFSGSLRVKDSVVTSGAKSDGFVAKVGADGALAWLVRIGGPGADAVQGVAARGGRIAVAGTFAAGADLLGVPLPAFDDRSPFADGFVAELAPDGTRRWSASFGGKQAETVAGVAIDDRGSVVVAASARDTVQVGGSGLAANGLADGLLAWWSSDGTASNAVLVGGTDFDGLRSIVGVGDRIVVGGFYSGTLTLGGTHLVAGGGDGAFLATYDHRGAVVDAIDVGGAGREEIVALAASAEGILAGVAHTASASITGASLPAPKDPLTGAALVVRGVR